MQTMIKLIYVKFTRIVPVIQQLYMQFLQVSTDFQKQVSNKFYESLIEIQYFIDALVPGGGRDERGTILQEQLHHLSVIVLGCQVDRLLVLVIVEVHHGVQVHKLLARLLLGRKGNYLFIF